MFKKHLKEINYSLPTANVARVVTCRDVWKTERIRTTRSPARQSLSSAEWRRDNFGANMSSPAS
ncbi:hypothetical protein MSG28_014086, partial [Choristoneura fumiferana]